MGSPLLHYQHPHPRVPPCGRLQAPWWDRNHLRGKSRSRWLPWKHWRGEGGGRGEEGGGGQAGASPLPAGLWPIPTGCQVISNMASPENSSKGLERVCEPDFQSRPSPRQSGCKTLPKPGAASTSLACKDSVLPSAMVSREINPFIFFFS